MVINVLMAKQIRDTVTTGTLCSRDVMYINHKHSGAFQTGDITYKGRSSHIKNLRRDIMIKGGNESRDVVTKGRFKQTGT